MKHPGAFLAVLAMLTAGLTAQQKAGSPNGPWLGTWRLNLAKSKYSPGPGPAAGTVTIFKMGTEKDGFKYTLDSTLPDGKKTHAEAFGRFDGKEYPEIGNPAADFNVFTRVDDHTYALVDRKNGKDALSFRITISADGKTRTSRGSGKTASGQEVNNVGVWDRVE